MTTATTAQASTDAGKKTYAKPELRPVGSVAELTLGALVTAMPENGSSGTSQV